MFKRQVRMVFKRQVIPCMPLNSSRVVSATSVVYGKVLGAGARAGTGQCSCLELVLM